MNDAQLSQTAGKAKTRQPGLWWSQRELCWI